MADPIVKSYKTAEGLNVEVYKSGRRRVNGNLHEVSSLTDWELACIDGYQDMPECDDGAGMYSQAA